MNNNQGRRRTRRVRQQRKQKSTQISRILLTICMMALVAVVSIGGTLAWLTDSSEEVVNTFATSGIDIKLTESDYDKTSGEFIQNDVENHSETDYQLIPGKAYPKDPTVTVDCDTTNVDIYLFVKFDAVNNVGEDASTYLTYEHIWETDSNWKKLDGVEGVNNVWYREVLDSETSAEYSLIKDETVTVKSNLVKTGETAENTVEMPTDKLTMKYTAYAVQKEGSANAAEAWAKIGN